MNKLRSQMGFFAVALAMNPKLLEQFNAPLQAENLENQEINLSDADKHRIESAKKKRARKLERNKK